ncbi:MAG: rod shape-determining protein MreC [Candidatus Saganbacteria bacterium]|nr:rod shape-determining protein MreC [Candidatus Saganbacteria bacterium]
MPFFSRRFIITLFLIFCLLLIFNLPPFSESSFSKGVKRAGVFFLYPFQYAFSALFDISSNSISDLAALRNAQNENQALKKEIESLKLKEQPANGLQDENQRLREALGFAGRNPYGASVIPAEVVIRSPSLFFQSVMVNKGSRHGVAVNMAVVNAEGLVGKIGEVFDYTSRVVFLIDAGQAVSVVDRNTRDFAVAQGTGGGLLELKYVLSQASVATGDAITTSGASDVYPPHIPIGNVVSVNKRDVDLFQTVKVKPRVDFSKLDQLSIIKGY